jgi:hypothetical protein
MQRAKLDVYNTVEGRSTWTPQAGWEGLNVVMDSTTRIKVVTWLSFKKDCEVYFTPPV